MPDGITLAEAQALLAQVATLREQLEALIARLRAEEAAQRAGLGAPTRRTRLV